MKKRLFFFILISFSLLAYGCDSKNKKNQTVNDSTPTSTTTSEINQIKLSKEYLLGRWQSTEQDWPMEINVYENPETNQLELNILSPEDAAGIFKTTSGYSSFSSVDNSVRYKFALYDNHLTMVKIITSDNPKEVGAIRPWNLEKISSD